MQAVREPRVVAVRTAKTEAGVGRHSGLSSTARQCTCSEHGGGGTDAGVGGAFLVWEASEGAARRLPQLFGLLPSVRCLPTPLTFFLGLKKSTVPGEANFRFLSSSGLGRVCRVDFFPCLGKASGSSPPPAWGACVEWTSSSVRTAHVVGCRLCVPRSCTGLRVRWWRGQLPTRLPLGSGSALLWAPQGFGPNLDVSRRRVLTHAAETRSEARRAGSNVRARRRFRSPRSVRALCVRELWFVVLRATPPNFVTYMLRVPTTSKRVVVSCVQIHGDAHVWGLIPRGLQCSRSEGTLLGQ